jgi:hypothetical protein
MVKKEVASRKFSTEFWSSESIDGQCTASANGENAPPYLGHWSGDLRTSDCSTCAKPIEKMLYSDTALEAVFHQPCE